MSVARLMRKISNWPTGTGAITVFMKDGLEHECFATKIVSDEFTGIMIYYKGKAIDASKAVGWMPATAPRRETSKCR